MADIADHIAVAHNAVSISDEILAMISKAIQEEIRIRAARA